MKLIFATGNTNKVREINELLRSRRDLQVIGMNDLGFTDEIDENGATIEANAIIKAEAIYKKFGVPVFAEDTGLEVQGLNGQPGVFSARYAGPQRNADDNMGLLLDQLKLKSDRSARFKTVIAFRSHEALELFEGIVEGHITMKRAGSGGFGYDPIFKPNGFAQTFGELPLDIKSKISHRARAWNKFVDHLNLYK